MLFFLLSLFMRPTGNKTKHLLIYLIMYLISPQQETEQNKQTMRLDDRLSMGEMAIFSCPAESNAERINFLHSVQVITLKYHSRIPMKFIIPIDSHTHINWSTGWFDIFGYQSISMKFQTSHTPKSKARRKEEVEKKQLLNTCIEWANILIDVFKTLEILSIRLCCKSELKASNSLIK